VEQGQLSLEQTQGLAPGTVVQAVMPHLPEGESVRRRSAGSVQQGARAYGRPADGSPVRTALTFALRKGLKTATLLVL
jgi:hypothetical protein